MTINQTETDKEQDAPQAVSSKAVSQGAVRQTDRGRVRQNAAL